MKIHNDLSRIYIMDDLGKFVGDVKFPSIGEGKVMIASVYVDSAHRGQGMADILMKELVKQLEEKGLKAYVKCSYAKSWFEKHKEYEYLMFMKENE